MSPVWTCPFAQFSTFLWNVSECTTRRPLEDTMWDLLYIGLTIVVFGVLWLIVKGVESFER
jgi:hypothetical protein